MGSGGDHTAWRDGEPGGRQELEHRDLALEPLVGIVVQHHRAGHYAGDHRCGTQVDEQVACGGHDGSLLKLQAVRGRDPAHGLQRPPFKPGIHAVAIWHTARYDDSSRARAEIRAQVGIPEGPRISMPYWAATR